MLQSNLNNLTTMNPLNSRDLLGKINNAVMSFSGKKILLVEGYNDENLYKNHIVKGLGKTDIEVLPVYGDGLYLDDDDIEMLTQKRHTKPGDVSAKLTIILLIKRCYAREWAKGTLCNKFYGIVDRDFFFDDEMQSVKDSFLTYSSPMTDEDWKAYCFDAVSNGRLVTTDTNDVETLIFKYDFDAVKNACTFKDTINYLDSFKNIALKIACKNGYVKYKWEENRNNGFFYHNDTLKFRKFYGIIDWKYCKGHVLVKQFLKLVNKKKKHFNNDKQFINVVMQHINLVNFSNTKVYNFIVSI